MTDITSYPTYPHPEDALTAVLEGARIADPIVETEEGRRFAFLPDGFDLKEITDPDRLSPAIKQSVVVDDANSLSVYTNRFSDRRSIILADYDSLSIVAALDWHHANDAEAPLSPDRCAHKATLKLRDSEEFQRWNAVQGDMHEQSVFAEFLEENAVDVIHPEPSTLIEISRDLEATQGVKFKAGNRLESGDRSFTYETDTHVKGEISVPREFTLGIPLFQGEEPTEIRAAFRFRPRPDGLYLGFVWRRVEYRRQAEFALIATRVSEATGLPVVFGR